MKEVAISAIGGAAGGAFFGGIAGASASTASAAASSTAGTAARTIGKYATAFGAGFVGGTAADAASQKMTTGDVNWGHAVGTGIFSGGVAAAGYGLSQTKVGQYVTRPIQRYIYDPIYARSSVGIGTITRMCSAELGSASLGLKGEMDFYNEFATRARNAGLSQAQTAEAFNAMRNGDYSKMASYFDTSSPRDGAVFWSGDKNGAAKYATANGGTIMEQTPGGQVFDGWNKLADVYPEWGTGTPLDQKSLWVSMSEQYASGASGQVTYCKPATYNNPESVWIKYENPIVLDSISTGQVTGINYIEP